MNNTLTPQQLELLHKLQANHLSPFEAKALLFSMLIPFLPFDKRIDIYYSLINPHSAIHTISFPLLFICISLVAFVITLLSVLVPLLVKFFLLQRSKAKSDTVFLAITPPQTTLQSSHATSELFSILHNLALPKTYFAKLFDRRKQYSLEIVATKDNGIRYLIQVKQEDKDIVKKDIYSFLPTAKIVEVDDYLPETFNVITDKVIDFALSRSYAYPLETKKTLSDSDPIAYITGMMTKLNKDELMALQLVVKPAGRGITRNANLILNDMLNNKNVFSRIDRSTRKIIVSFPLFLLRLMIFSIMCLLTIPLGMITFFMTDGKAGSLFPHIDFLFPSSGKAKYNSHQEEIVQEIKQKLDQHLFEVTLRTLFVVESATQQREREKGILSSLSSFHNPGWQSLKPFQSLTPTTLLKRFKKMLPFIVFSQRSNWFSPILVFSVAELTDLYHFPYTDTTKTEGLVTSKSYELPAPLSMKKATTHLDVVVGMNTYGGELTPVGLTEKQRKQHMYILGKTGMGKSTIIESMALQDIANEKGVCIIDAHGDMLDHILTLIPKERLKDVISVNPADKAFPPGINILSPRIKYQDKEEEHGFIARSVIEIIRKITPEKHWGQRMEHILRNTTITALQIPTGTPETPFISLFAIQKLLTDENYRKIATKDLKDPVLAQFWKKEFQLFRKEQQGELISPLTNKIGEFITDTLSRHVLLQEHSTFSIAEIMDEGKILLVNLSKGKLGEERSAFFGTVITSLIQLAINERAQTPEQKRRDFFVYIDEFQNFATPHFTQLFSEARKYHVYFIPSHQNIAQIEDTKVSKIIQGNSGTIVALKGSPDDEKTILPFLEPEVEKGQIVNLAPYNFFMKVTNEESEDAFSAVTIPIGEIGSERVAEEIIDNSRKNYATPRVDVEKQMEKLFKETPTKRTKKPEEQEQKPTKPNGIKHIPVETKQQLV